MFTLPQKTKVAVVTIAVALTVLTACGGVPVKLAQPEEKAPAAAQVESSQQTGSAAEPVSIPVEVNLNITEDARLGNILTDDQGMTLYTFKNDQPLESTCYDACAQKWPPFVVAEGQKLALPKDAVGTLDTLERKDGAYQVTYNDMPLYFFAKDTKPGETNGQEVNNVWYVVSLNGADTAKEESAILTQPGLQANDEWIVAEETFWLPVVDGMGQHLQMARQHFETKDFKAAATEIRAAADFLKDESAHVSNPASQDAIQAATDDLAKLATQVEAGKVSSIEGLNTIFRQAYQADIEHRVSGLTAEARADLTEQPGMKFEQAVAALDKDDAQTAAIELQKGIAFAKIEAAAATGRAKDDLTAAIAELETMAGQLAAGQPVDGEALGQLLARTHHALADHHIARSGEAQANNNLKEVGYELNAAAHQLELALTRTGHKVDGETAARLEELRTLAGQLIKGDTPEMSQIAQAIEVAGQELGNLDQILKAEQAQATPAQPIEFSDGWIIVNEDTWIPVFDNFTRHIQLAHQAFLDDDVQTAADEVRRSAAFLKSEATNLETESGKTAFNATASDLEILADRIEQRKIEAIEDLEGILLRAYDTDVQYRLVPASSQEYAPLVEWPVTHLGRAMEAFDRGDTQKAAEEISKAAGLLRLDEARATGLARTGLKNAITVLEQTAKTLDEGHPISGEELDKAFVHAYQALGNQHYLRATKAVERKALKEAGLEIQAVAQYLHQLRDYNDGQNPKTTVALEQDLQALSEKLINGSTFEAGEVSRMLDQTGRELENIGQMIGAADETAEWVLVQEDTYIPVVDELGRRLQSARQNFETGDMKTAAMDIRLGAEFLQQEEMGPGSDENIAARAKAAESLIELAGKVEQGQIKAAQELNTVFTEAYRVDVEHRLVHLKSEEIAHLVDKPAQHLERALEAFNHQDNQLAAIEIRKALAFFNLDEARAGGAAKDVLKETTANLATLAVQLENNQPLTASELETTIAQAHHALADYHHNRAAEATDPAEAGYELQAAAHHLERTLLRADHQIEGEQAAFINDLNTLANDMITGKSIDAEQVSQMLERLGQELEDLGQEIGTTTHMPNN